MGDILGGKRVISIHAPREGSDLLDYTVIMMQQYFNPRSP